MKLCVVLALIAVVSTAPQNPQDVQIVRNEVNNDGLGSYNFAWETSNDSKHEEQGQLKNQGTENEAISVQGQYSWIGPDDFIYTVNYIADENGYQPQILRGGIPRAVLKALLAVS